MKSRQISRGGEGFRGVAFGILAGVICAAIAAALGFGDGFVNKYGVELFIVMPFAIGCASAIAVDLKRASLIGLVVATVFALAPLPIIGVEMFFCCLMAWPVMIGSVALGMVLGIVVRHVAARFRRPTVIRLVMIGACGVLTTGAFKAEQASPFPHRHETVVSRRVVQAAPEGVWNAIVHPSALPRRTPLLMRLGLPRPRACTVEGEGTGSRRVCHFDEADVVEVVTRWEPPQRMDMAIVDAEFPGAPWLSIESASYELRSVANGTEVTRGTSITSTLRPGVYWRFIESLGVRTVHGFVLDGLAESLRPSIAGPNGIAETMALNRVTDVGLVINSAWRNPERNEAVGGVFDSRHQFGDAIDIRPATNVAGKTPAQLWCILVTAADHVPGANGFSERGSAQLDCDLQGVSHVHVQR